MSFRFKYLQQCLVARSWALNSQSLSFTLLFLTWELCDLVSTHTICMSSIVLRMKEGGGIIEKTYMDNP